ncbi:MAG: glycosyltransferase family 2 protein [Planctomycetota bacterium]
MDISVIVPIHNERENIPVLYEQLKQALTPLGRPYEMLLVDDGSTDGSYEGLVQLAARDNRVKLIQFRRNYGQTAAMQAGIQWASGEIIVTMDGDLQNDPDDIPMMLDRMDEGYDLVQGWRRNRQDKWFSRRLPSRIANSLISRITGYPVHDLGCTLKAIRREVARDLDLYGEMHRFIPMLAHARGARCVEVETHHRAREHGVSKYGISRTGRVILDLITVKYILSYFASPMKLFGHIGMGFSCLTTLAFGGTVGMKIWGHVDMTGNPLLLLTVFCMMAAIQFFGLGLLGEVSARIYYGSQNKQQYSIRELTNFEGSGTDRGAPPRIAA